MKYFIINIRHQDLVDKINNLEEFEFQGISWYVTEIKLGDRVYFHFGGDKAQISWDTGIAGFGEIVRSPFDIATTGTKYYKIRIQPKVVFDNVISRSLSRANNSLDLIGWVDGRTDPNQAIRKLGQAGKPIDIDTNFLKNVKLLKFLNEQFNDFKSKIFNEEKIVNSLKDICSYNEQYFTVTNNRPKTNDERCDPIVQSLRILKNNLEIYLLNIDTELIIEVSHGKGNLGYIPHLVIKHLGQDTSDGFYVVILFELKGRGFVCGMAKSATNAPEGFDLPDIVKVSEMDGDEMIIDSPREGSPNYDESVFTPKKFKKNDDFFSDFEKHLKDSIDEYCSYFIDEGEENAGKTDEEENLISPELVFIQNFFGDFKIKDLVFTKKNKKAIERQITSAIESGKHIILSGPPGTGKTKLSKQICEHYVEDEYQMTTATSEWSTFDTLGGYLPKKDGTVEFSPGILLNCFKDENGNKNDWLVIDEINRSDIDKALGQFQSVLTKDNVILPFIAEDGERIEIIYDDEVYKSKHKYYVRSDWRMIGSMNTFDKSSLYEMSYALQRRFVIIPVYGPESKNINEKLLKEYLTCWGIDLDDVLMNKIINLWKIMSEYRQVGPGIVHDFINLIQSGSEYHEAICSIILPQFDGDERMNDIIIELRDKNLIDDSQKNIIELFIKEILSN